MTHMAASARLSLGLGALLSTLGDPLGEQAMLRWGLSIHAIGYMSVSSVHSAPQPPVFPRTATFPKFLCDDRTGPTAPPCPPTPCLKIPHGAALPLVRVRCGQTAPPDGSTPEYLPVPRGGSGIKDQPIQRVGLPSLFLPMVSPQSWVLRFGGRLVLPH